MADIDSQGRHIRTERALARLPRAGAFYSYHHDRGSLYKGPGIETIKQAAGFFGVSLSAAAIRYSQVGNFPVAVIMAHKGKVLWSSISELFPYQYIGKNYPVNGYSEADAFFARKEIDLSPHSVLEDSWFQNDSNFRKERHPLIEQCLPMPGYNSVLTVVWL